MNKNNYQILLYYKYITLDNPKSFYKKHIKLCNSLNLKGRIIIAKEGVNSTVEGLESNIKKYISTLKSIPGFENTHIKLSKGNGRAFPRMSIKLRNEIVSSYLDKKGLPLNPNIISGKYIFAEQLHEWIKSKKEFYIVDMRNDYEHDVGYFKNSILAPFKNFRDLPEVLPVLKNLKNKIIVTVCTGGVRCEKASGFLVANGFTNVYQLYGGIVTYMEKYPNEDFLGKLYVFDGRITIGFNTKDKNHVIVGKCAICKLPADTYYDCLNTYCTHKRHFVSCKKCIKQQKGYCKNCFEQNSEPKFL